MRMTGTVKWFNDIRGFGFIRPDAGNGDVFVHYSGIEQTGPERRSLEDGQKVEFEVVQGEKGPQAVKVKKAA